MKVTGMEEPMLHHTEATGESGRSLWQYFLTRIYENSIMLSRAMNAIMLHNNSLSLFNKTTTAWSCFLLKLYFILVQDVDFFNSVYTNNILKYFVAHIIATKIAVLNYVIFAQAFFFIKTLSRLVPF